MAKSMMILLGVIERIRKNRKFSLTGASMKRTADFVRKLTKFAVDEPDKDMEFDEVILGILFYLLTSHNTMKEVNEDYKKMCEKEVTVLGEYLSLDDEEDEPERNNSYIPRPKFHDPGVR
jgi:hypothetical protein